MLSARDRQTQDRFEELLDRAEAPGFALGFDELRELAHLYRGASARLAMLRSRRRNDPELVRYLNALCVRAYTHLQAPPQARTRARQFFLQRFPATLAASASLQVLSAILMLSGGIVGATIVSENPAAVYACIPSYMYPPDMLERLVESRQQRQEFLSRKKVEFGLKSVFSASLFVHNTRVGLISFAAGILAGVPTLLLVFYNGLTLGVFAWIFSRDNQWPAFWAWVLPHAVPELLGIILCSTAGLMIGRASVAA